ncbi:hypothetical protein BKA70DRAFT_497922 [Coprinopsis sp. MPI-PUGE-AT-0042]|nr:hypothetical protein BKA70DRAFT_497922 [Coprinopsis sp. MPI-PUGE-AT-0042]
MDIWYQIAASLDPPDIVTLRTVSTTIHLLPKTNIYHQDLLNTFSICKQHSIWLQATRTMCRSHGLFLPSFPLETMSVKELMRLALSPYIFSRLVSTQGQGRLPEIHSRAFRPRLERHGKALEVRSLHLLPGGRYLFTYHEGDVCLWDLGYGPVFPSPFPIAVLHIGRIRSSHGEKLPCPTEDGKTVRLIVYWALGLHGTSGCTTSVQVGKV